MFYGFSCNCLATAGGVVYSHLVLNIPPLLHGNDWHGQDVSGWWCSEKFDGWRAYWDGQRLLSRQGRDYQAPAWFLAGLPAMPLDCELWAGNGSNHNHVAGLDWERLRLVAFDVPGLAVEDAMATLALLPPSPRLQVAEFWQVDSTDGARAAMAQVVARGGEGVMLRRPGSVYRNTRCDDLLKLKP